MVFVGLAGVRSGESFWEHAKILKIKFSKLIPCHYIKANKNIISHEFIVIKQISIRLLEDDNFCFLFSLNIII